MVDEAKLNHFGAILARETAASLMDADPLAAMKDLDRARGDPRLDLGADQGARNRIEEAMDFNVIVEVDARAPPFRELRVVGQGDEGVALDLLEQFAPAQPSGSSRSSQLPRSRGRANLL
jgi:hypothetical protein